MEKKRLGRGLDALLGGGEGPATAVAERPPDAEVALERIERNPYQPRQRMQREELERLAASIAEHGVLQPILVTETVDGYRLIAGERRLRAAELAGLERIPAIVREADDRERLAFALVENVQRADLNAMEEAQAYRRLIDEFGYSQEDVGRAVGRARPSVANTLRLLELSPRVQAAITEGSITEGHGRAIGGVADHRRQDELFDVVAARALSVRQTEELARGLRDGDARPRRERPPADPELERLTNDLRASLATKVSITPGRRGGRITIEYYDADELDRLVAVLTRGDR